MVNSMKIGILSILGSGAGREKRLVALSSVVAAVFLTSMKLIVGLLTGSLGILAEAAHSGLDLIAAAVNEAIRKSQEMMTEEMKKITGGLSVPGLF